MIITIPTFSKCYNVSISDNALDELVPCINGISPTAKIALLSDDNVWSLYSRRLERLLSEAKKDFAVYVIEHGERSKTPETLFAFLEFMAEKEITRSDLVIALGGGVVGDLAGLAASLYLRGVRLIQIPTSLLAMVDSSVGGKTAVDLRAGKNLAGSFYQPDAVICDISFTKTLPADIFRDGCAEIIKYGIILDSGLFYRLKGEGGIKKPETLQYAIERSVALKRDIVAQDERDTGTRALLNFGHTFAHSIEKLSGLTVSHGAAVAKGMFIACKLSAALGICDITSDVSSCLEDFCFDLSPVYSAEELVRAAMSDKKRAGDIITLILPEAVGKCISYKIRVDELLPLLERALS